MKKKKLFTIIAVLFTFVILSISVVSAQEKRIYDNYPLDMDETFDIVEYDPMTQKETHTTLKAENSYVKKEYDKLLSKNRVATKDSFGIFEEGYMPENLIDEKDVISPKGIIDGESRVRKPNNVHPNSAILHLRLGFDNTGDNTPDIWLVGSGFMVGQKIMVTAAHNYYSKTNGWVKECRTYVNLHGSTRSGGWEYPGSWTLPSNYTSNQDYRYDWAVVKMQNPIGKTTGSLGYGTGYTMKDKDYTFTGYPSSYLYYRMGQTGKVISETEFEVKTKVDLTGGQSGGAVYSSGNIAHAIITREGKTRNSANKITSWCYDLIKSGRASTQ